MGRCAAHSLSLVTGNSLCVVPLVSISYHDGVALPAGSEPKFLGGEEALGRPDAFRQNARAATSFPENVQQARPLDRRDSGAPI